VAPLDDLYGAGASAAFALAVTFAPPFDAPVIEEVALAEGNVRANVTWGDASAKIECSPDDANWLTLQSGSDDAAGLYTAICDHTPAFFKSRGVVTYTCSPTDDQSEAVLRSRGAWGDLDSRGTMRWKL
jgi:hypothetical protein